MPDGTSVQLAFGQHLPFPLSTFPDARAAPATPQAGSLSEVHFHPDTQALEGWGLGGGEAGGLPEAKT